MILIEGLNKSFDENHVLRDVNLKISKGEIYGLVGKSGAGKSTLLRCINGLEKFDSGKLLINGNNVSDKNKKEIRQMRRKIGMIFQNYSLIENRTVYQNIALPMKCWKYSKKEIHKKVISLLEMVDLMDKKDAYPGALSGGQKQRVAIARALTMDPEILLCDEATSALDPNTTQSVLELIDKINKEMGLTTVIVTHQMEVVRSICDTISILEDGNVVESGPVTDIFMKNPPALRKLLGKNQVKVPDMGKTISFFVPSEAATVISEMSRILSEDIVVLTATNDCYHGKFLTLYTVNISEKKEMVFVDELEKRNIKWCFVDPMKGEED